MLKSTIFALFIFAGGFLPTAVAQRCESLFENSNPFLPNRPGFIDPGLGIVYPKKSSEPIAVRIKLTRDDLYYDHSVRQQAAKVLNMMVAPVSAIIGAHKLSGVVNKLINDMRPIPYPVKLAESFSLKIKTSFLTALEQIPSEGPAIIVGTHPLAGIDAMSQASITTAVRKKADTLIVLTDSLKELPGIHENAVLIDVSGTPEGKVKNRAARQRIIDHLKNRGCIIMFPSGSNSDMGTNGKLVEASWKPGLFDFASEVPETVIVPMYITGKLSRLYYQVKQINRKMVTPLLPRELAAQIGATVEIRIGEGIVAATALQIAKNHVDQSTELNDSSHSEQIKNTFLGFFRSQVSQLEFSWRALDEPVSPSELYYKNQ